MSNVLEKFYNKFNGLDTRSNKLLQDPGSFRKGSKNFRYDFQDQITNAQGFQHKDAGAPNFVDQFEYKYRDVNSGQALTQILGVATDGKLYKRRTHSLRFSAHGVATSVSMYFDEVANTFKMTLNGLGSVVIGDTMQLATGSTSGLVGALNALTGVTALIVDDTGATVATSTNLAYLLDCVINDTAFGDNPVYYWEEIPFPDASSVPFPVTVANYTSSEYEGISSINLNNCIYMVDGGFPMKYDGKSVYRAGVPNIRQIINNADFLNFDSVIIDLISSSTFGSTGLTIGKYGYNYRYAFRDYQGAEYFSNLCQYTQLKNATVAFTEARLSNYGYLFGKDFPVYSITAKSTIFDPIATGTVVGGTGADLPKVFSKDTILDRNYNYTTIQIDANVTVHLNGYTLFRTGAFTSGAGASIKNCVVSRSSGNITYNIEPIKNVIVGQCLIVKTYTSNQNFTNAYFDGYYYLEIISIDNINNTITVKEIAGVNVYGTITVNSYWVPTEFVNKKETSSTAAPFGASIEVFRTKVNQIDSAVFPYVPGPLYLIGHDAIPFNSAKTQFFFDDKQDNQLNVLYDDLDPGQELPRGCKYLSQVQNQLVQAGLSLNYDLKNNEYPNSRQSVTSTTNDWAKYPNLLKYTEAMFCDFQSVYWADALSPEGFPQDGLHEISIDTKFADKIKAVAPNKDVLFAFKERSSAVISGTFATNDVVLEILEADAGCVSHKTVEEVRGALVWLDKVNGFYSCVAGRLPENIGFPIQDYMKINTEGLDYGKATAANYRKESLYVCSVGNTTFVFDYADSGNLKRNCWYLWDRILGNSVIATSDDKLLIFDGTRTWKMKLTHTKYDFTDHKSAIPLVLNTAWLNQSFPTVDKHYVALWINSIQGDFTLVVKQYGNFLEQVISTQNGVQFIEESSAKQFIKAQVKAAIPKLSSISFGLENAEQNKWVRIQGYEVQYNPDFNTGEPKR